MLYTPSCVKGTSGVLTELLVITATMRAARAPAGKNHLGTVPVQYTQLRQATAAGVFLY